MAKKPRKGPKTLYDLVNELDPTFTSEVYTFTDDTMNKKLAEMSKVQSELEDAMSDDMDLKSLKEQVKVASAGYREQFKSLKLKRKLIHKILSERGKPA